jgi:hypothetical protein
MSKKLFDDESASDAGGDLKINEEFARKFEHNQKRVELERL